MEPATCRARSAERPQVPSELQRQPPSPGLSVASAPRRPPRPLSGICTPASIPWPLSGICTPGTCPGLSVAFALRAAGQCLLFLQLIR